MLLSNLSKDLVNGSTGVVKEFILQRFPLVEFNGGCSFTIEPKTLTVADRNDPSKIVAKRTQLLLKLAWAITAHKSQGMTLPCVEVHCGNEFTSGQLYVSLSRVKESQGLSLVGFANARLIPPPNVVDFYSKLEREDNVLLSNLCCNKAKVSNEVIDDPNNIENIYFENDVVEDDQFMEKELLALENSVAEYFESTDSNDNDDSCLLDLDDILQGLDCEDDLSKPDNDFDYALFLKSTKLPSNENCPLVKDINAVVDSFVSPEHLTAFQHFNIQWNRVYGKIKECVLAHKECKIERNNFVTLFGQLHLLHVSEALTKEFASVLQIEPSQLKKTTFLHSY